MFEPTHDGLDHRDMLTYVYGAGWKLYEVLKVLKVSKWKDGIKSNAVPWHHVSFRGRVPDKGSNVNPPCKLITYPFPGTNIGAHTTSTSRDHHVL